MVQPFSRRVRVNSWASNSTIVPRFSNDVSAVVRSFVEHLLAGFYEIVFQLQNA